MTISAPERPDSGAIENQGQGRILVRRYTYRKDFNWEAEMPAIGATGEGGLYFRGYRSIPDPAYAVVELTWGVADSYQHKSGDDIWTFDAQPEERDIELHTTAAGVKDFLMLWKYDLWEVAGGPAAAPGWATTAKDPSDADGKTYLWSQEHPGDGWFRVAMRTKPGIESYYHPRFVSRLDQYRSSYATAAGLKGAVGTRVTPTQTFSVSTGNWLVTGTSLKQGNGLWCASIEYTNGNWDTDVYA